MNFFEAHVVTETKRQRPSFQLQCLGHSEIHDMDTYRPTKRKIPVKKDVEMQQHQRYAGGLPMPLVVTSEEKTIKISQAFNTIEHISECSLMQYAKEIASGCIGTIKPYTSSGSLSTDLIKVIMCIIQNNDVGFLCDIFKIDDSEYFVSQRIQTGRVRVFEANTGQELLDQEILDVFKYILVGDIESICLLMKQRKLIFERVYHNLIFLFSECMTYRIKVSEIESLLTKYKFDAQMSPRVNHFDSIIGSISYILKIIGIEKSTICPEMLSEIKLIGRFNWWSMENKNVKNPKISFLLTNQTFKVDCILTAFLSHIIYQQLSNKDFLENSCSDFVCGKISKGGSSILLVYTFNNCHLYHVFINDTDIMVGQDPKSISMRIKLMKHSCVEYDQQTIRRFLKSILCKVGQKSENVHTCLTPLYGSQINRGIIQNELISQKKKCTYINYLGKNIDIPCVFVNGEVFLALQEKSCKKELHTHFENFLSDVKLRVDDYICENLDNVNKLTFLVEYMRIIKDLSILNYVKMYSCNNHHIKAFIKQWVRENTSDYSNFIELFMKYMNTLADNVYVIGEKITCYHIQNSFEYVFSSVPDTGEVKTLLAIINYNRNISEWDLLMDWNDDDNESSRPIENYDEKILYEFVKTTHEIHVLSLMRDYGKHIAKLRLVTEQVYNLVRENHNTHRKSWRETHLKILKFLSNDVHVISDTATLALYVICENKRTCLGYKTKQLISYTHQNSWDFIWAEIISLYNSDRNCFPFVNHVNLKRALLDTIFLNLILEIITRVLSCETNHNILDIDRFCYTILSLCCDEIPQNFKNNNMTITPFLSLVRKGYDIRVNTLVNYDNDRQLSYGKLLQSLQVVKKWLYIHVPNIRVGVISDESMHIIMINEPTLIRKENVDTCQFFSMNSPVFKHVFDTLMTKHTNPVDVNTFFLNSAKLMVSHMGLSYFLNAIGTKVREYVSPKLLNIQDYILYTSGSIKGNHVSDIESLLEKVEYNVINNRECKIYNGYNLLLWTQYCNIENDIIYEKDMRFGIYMDCQKHCHFVIKQWPIDDETIININSIQCKIKELVHSWSNDTINKPLCSHFSFIMNIVSTICNMFQNKFEFSKLMEYVIEKTITKPLRAICYWLFHMRSILIKSFNSFSHSAFELYISKLDLFLVEAQTSGIDITQLQNYTSIKLSILELSKKNNDIECTVVIDDGDWEWCIASKQDSCNNIIILNNISDNSPTDGTFPDIITINKNVIYGDVPWDIFNDHGGLHRDISWYMEGKLKLFRSIVEHMGEKNRKKIFSKIAPIYFIQDLCLSFSINKIIPDEIFSELFSKIFSITNTCDNRTLCYRHFFGELESRIRTLCNMNSNTSYSFVKTEQTLFRVQFIELVNNRRYFIVVSNRENGQDEVNDCIFLGTHNSDDIADIRNYIISDESFSQDCDFFKDTTNMFSQLKVVETQTSTSVKFPDNIFQHINIIKGFNVIQPECLPNMMKVMVEFVKAFPICATHICDVVDIIIRQLNQSKI
jgi:hypothetical protein